MTASPEERGVVHPGTARTGTPNAGNAGERVGSEEIDGQLYARYRATPGTWVSASMREQGYARLYGQERGYGAYAGLVRAPDGTPLGNPDRVRPGQEYLVPVLGPAQPAPASMPAPAPAPASARTSAPAPAAASAPAPARASQTAPIPPGALPGPAAGGRLTATEAARGTANRYGPGQPPPNAPPILAGAAPLLVPAARPAANALARAALRWGGAELLSGEGLATEEGLATAGRLARLGGPVVAAALAAVLAWGWAGYKWYGVYREWRSAEQAKADARDLLRQARQGMHTLWQNGIITDEEYFLYLSTGTLVLQPDRPAQAPASGAGGAIGFEQKKATDERWYYVLLLGTAYNRARTFDHRFREVYVEGPNGRRFRVDFFDLDEIISQKRTQFALIAVETGIGYIHEMVEKYAPGTVISPVTSNTGVLEITKVLTGRMVLNVPVQRYPIPREVLEEAEKLGVTIRDDFGNEFKLDEPQPTHSDAPAQPKSTITWPRRSPDESGSPDGGTAAGYIELTE